MKHLSRSSTKQVVCVQQTVYGKQNLAKTQQKTKDLTSCKVLD